MRARRLAPALCAALLLAACSVDVEGAPCKHAFAAQDPAECPDGQACGNDGKCSARAFACLASSETHCKPSDRTQDACLDPGRSRYCTDADPVCGAWGVEDCAAKGMVCNLRGTSNRCECPEPALGTPTLYADAARGSPKAETLPFPRGLAEPPECRYGNLWDALHAATAVFTPIAVSATGRFSRNPDRPDTTWPLTVAANVTLLATDPSNPPTLLGDPEDSTSVDPTHTRFLFEAEGTVSGLRVEGGPSTFGAIRLRCNPGMPVLRGVAVSGADGSGQRLAVGILVGGAAGPGTACGGQLFATTVTGVQNDALLLDPDPSGIAKVFGGSFGGSQIGIRAVRGTMAVEPDPATSTVKVRVAGNSKDGVRVDNLELANALDVTLTGLDVTGNGGTGIAAGANTLPAAAKVRIRGSDVHGNGKAQATAIGGILFPASATSIAAFEISSTRVWSNAGDQVGVAATSAAAIGLPAGACGPSSNWIGCAGAGASIRNLSVTQTLNVYSTFFTQPVAGMVEGTSCAGTFPAAPVCE